MDGPADKVDRLNMHSVVRRRSRAKITGTHERELELTYENYYRIQIDGNRLTSVRRGRRLMESTVGHVQDDHDMSFS